MDRGPGGATVTGSQGVVTTDGALGSALHMAGGFFTRRAVRRPALLIETQTQRPRLPLFRAPPYENPAGWSTKKAVRSLTEHAQRESASLCLPSR